MLIGFLVKWPIGIYKLRIFIFGSFILGLKNANLGFLLVWGCSFRCFLEICGLKNVFLGIWRITHDCIVHLVTTVIIIFFLKFMLERMYDENFLLIVVEYVILSDSYCIFVLKCKCIVLKFM